MNEPEVVSEIDQRASRDVVEYEPFQPILDRIVVRRIESNTDTDGFVVPEKYRQHTNIGEVLAIGTGVVLGMIFHDMDTFVEVGDRVLFGEYTAEKYVFEGDEQEIVRIQDVRGVFKRKKAE